MGQAPLLRSLRFVACFDSELPKSVVGLSGLQRLALEFNGMETMPAGPYLAGLQWLSLREGFLPQLPAALAAATALTGLQVQSLAASLPTAEVDVDGVAAVLTQLACLQTLQLANCKLVQLPAAALAAMSALHCLDLSNNAFAALPEGLSQASALRQLNLSGNMQLAPTAEQLGALLGHLPLLEELDLSGCGLMELPAHLPPGERRLACCAVLRACASRLRFSPTVRRAAKFPPVGRCCCHAGLLSLDVFHNSLHSLPTELASLSLTRLNLKHNSTLSLTRADVDSLLARLPRLHSFEVWGTNTPRDVQAYARSRLSSLSH